MEERKTGNTRKSALALVGELPDAFAAIVGKAADMAGESVHHEPNVEAALSWIDGMGMPPTCVALWMDPESRARDALPIRQKFELAAVPIVGIVRRIGDLAFEEAFASGID